MEPAKKTAPVAGPYFSLVLRQANRTAESYLNRPGIVKLRQVDERFYAPWQ